MARLSYSLCSQQDPPSPPSAFDVITTLQPDVPSKLSASSVRSLTIQQWASLWKVRAFAVFPAAGSIGNTPGRCLQEYVNALAGCLAEIPTDTSAEPDSCPAFVRMNELLQEAHKIIAGLAVLNPRTLRLWHALPNMERTEEGPPGPGWAEAVVVRCALQHRERCRPPCLGAYLCAAQDAVGLSQDQMRDGLALRRAYLLRSQRIVRERQAISTKLAELDHGLRPGWPGRSPFSMSNWVCALANGVMLQACSVFHKVHPVLRRAYPVPQQEAFAEAMQACG